MVGISDSVYRYEPDLNRDDAVIEAIQAVVERYPAYGFPKVCKILKRWGHPWNRKRIYRVYCKLSLNKRRRGKKRLPSRDPVKLSVPCAINQCWSINFMSDSLFCGRRFRTLNVVDDFNRAALGVEVDIGLPAERVVRVLDRNAETRGYPCKLRVDNGPEFISYKLAEWAELHDVELEFIQPGKPTQNSYIERFNRTYRDEILNMYVFKTLTEVRARTELWITEYNEERPHDSLDDMTPMEFMVTSKPSDYSSLLCT